MPAEPIAMVRETPNDRPPAASGSPSGVLLIDKPVGITSHDAVDRIRRIYRTRRVGHTGTLDPSASGLMLLLLGGATRIAPYLTALPKCYFATIRFGAVSDTGDAEGQLTQAGDPSSVATAQIQEALAGFVGSTAQRIPAYSAVRSGGRRRYQMARRGEDVPDLERTITIHRAELLSHTGDTADVRIDCSSGTYVRSLAEALGQAVGCGAHLCGLRREAVGRWHVHDALNLDSLQESKRRNESLPIPQPIEEYLDFPRIEVGPESLESVAHGSPIVSSQIVSVEGRFNRDDTILVVGQSRHVLAIASALAGDDELRRVPIGDPILIYKRVLIQ